MIVLGGKEYIMCAVIDAQLDEDRYVHIGPDDLCPMNT